ncbi:MAG TPA: sensor domain-containing protein [Candidatus Limnocylindrales bacterium]
MRATAGGPATTASSSRPIALLRSFLRSPFQAASWWATLAIVLGLGIAILSVTVLSACFSVGGSLLIWLIGIPIVALGLEVSMRFARLERWRMTLVDPRPLVPHPYRPLNGMPEAPYGQWLRTWAEAEFLDANRWRDVVYVLVLLPLGILEFVVSFVLWVCAITLVLAPLAWAAFRASDAVRFAASPAAKWGGGMLILLLVGLLLVPVAASVSRGLMRLHRAVVQGLLCVDPAVALRRDNERLRDSRAAALDLEASELRRIERDLHDGAQQRLVSLAIDLGRAEERIDSDPVAAKAIVADARSQARLALAELRDLVRGSMPAILVDRGLDAALASVAAACPVSTALVSTLEPGERLAPNVERAAYFVVVEALANVAKHSGAHRCEVALRRDPWALVVEVRDDGTGGAVVDPGGGLAGLRDRAQALDGTLVVSSPPGGPTVLRVELPLAAAATPPDGEG